MAATLFNSSADNGTSAGGGEVPAFVFWPEYTQPAVTIFSLFMVPIIVMGISGHLLLFAVMAPDKQFHTIPYALITSLAISDFGMVIFAIPFMLANVHTLYGTGKQGAHSVTGTLSCTAMGFIIDLSVTAIGFNMALIAINRQICIVHSKVYRTVFTKFTTSTYIILAWLLSLLLIIPTQIPGVCRIMYDPIYNICKYDEHMNPNYSLVLNLRSFIVPPILIIAYGAILIKVRKSKQSISASSGGNNTQSGGTISKEEISLMLQFLVIVVVYVSAWIFYMVLTVLATQFAIFLDNAGLYVNNLVGLNSAINPIVYFIFNKQMRHSAANMIGWGNRSSSGGSSTSNSGGGNTAGSDTRVSHVT